MDRFQAIISFDRTGKILSANENFCRSFGYSVPEIVGQHHSLFVDPAYAASELYRQFWHKLGNGQAHAAEFRRIAKGGREVWLQASYNPVCDAKGVVTRVIKLATDVTALKAEKARKDAELAGESGIAVIEFTPTGQILNANRAFLGATGYALDEIVGQHHRMFVSPEFAQSSEYGAFWRRLGAGHPAAGEFIRFGKGGKRLSLQAAYTPVVDDTGCVVRVVKMATDTTGRTHAVEVLGAALAQLAERNLTYRIAETLDPGFARLAQDFNAAITQLEGSVSSVVSSIDRISGGAREMASASDNLASRTEMQAAALEQTAATLDSLTSTVRRAAEGARAAGEAVGLARQEAGSSGHIVREAVSAMGEINGSAKEITSIISVIDEIAFQTNLLALNAGVEAARAGDAGRGFAVVASEVRALAQRSAEAAKEIKALISTSAGQVGRGVQLVDEAGQALGRIVGHVDRISEMVEQIAASAQEHASGITELNAAVSQMDTVTQQNAAMGEESTAAAQELANDAGRLRELTSQFRVVGGAAADGAPEAAARPRAPAKRVRPALAMAGD